MNFLDHITPINKHRILTWKQYSHDCKVIPSGFLPELVKNELTKFNLPFWLFHGDQPGIMDIGAAQNFAHAYQKNQTNHSFPVFFFQKRQKSKEHNLEISIFIMNLNSTINWRQRESMEGNPKSDGHMHNSMLPQHKIVRLLSEMTWKKEKTPSAHACSLWLFSTIIIAS